MKSYHEIESEILDEIKQIAAETESSVEKVFAIRQLTQAKAATRTQAQTEAKTEIRAEREAASHRLSEFLNSLPPGSRWPHAKDIAPKLGLPPTKSNLGWLAYQLRLAKPEAMAAAE